MTPHARKTNERRGGRRCPSSGAAGHAGSCSSPLEGPPVEGGRSGPPRPARCPQGARGAVARTPRAGAARGCRRPGSRRGRPWRGDSAAHKALRRPPAATQSNVGRRSAGPGGGCVVSGLERARSHRSHRAQPPRGPRGCPGRVARGDAPAPRGGRKPLTGRRAGACGLAAGGSRWLPRAAAAAAAPHPPPLRAHPALLGPCRYAGAGRTRDGPALRGCPRPGERPLRVERGAGLGARGRAGPGRAAAPSAPALPAGSAREQPPARGRSLSPTIPPRPAATLPQPESHRCRGRGRESGSTGGARCAGRWRAGARLPI